MPFFLRSALLGLVLLLPALAIAQERLVLTGSTTVYPLMSDIVERFIALNPDISIDLHSGGSGKGIAELRSRAADIAMVSRQLGESERDLFSFPLCRDGAAIIVNRSNTVKAFSAQQLSRVLTGKIADWKQLGARPGPIRLAWRTETQAIPEMILQQLKLKNGQVRSHKIILENTDAVEFVANDPNAVSLVALGVAERSVKSGAAIKLLAYEGVAASTRTVRDHTYLLSRPLILVTRSTPTATQKRLIDYALSGAVTDLHEKHGFVPYQD